jgi:hypothetical protein
LTVPPAGIDVSKSTISRPPRIEEEADMVLLLLLLVAILFGLGFVVKWLFIVAAVLFILWIAGWVAHSADRRWYYW